MTKKNCAVVSESPLLMPLALLNAVVLKYGFTVNNDWYRLLWVTVPLLILSMTKPQRKRLRSGPAWPAVRQERYTIEPIGGERLHKKRERIEYIRYRVFSKHR